MILDLAVLMVLVPFLILIGLSLVIYGREIMEVMSFPIGALAGGILAYMIIGGLLHGYNIPIWASVIFAAILAIGGGMVGKGTLYMLIAMFSATVIVDVISPFIGSGNDVILVVVGLLLFLGLVAIVPRFMEAFSAFVGGVSFAMGVTPFLEGMPVETIRIVQISVAIVLCVSGAFIQRLVYKKVAEMKEEITWVPSGENVWS